VTANKLIMPASNSSHDDDSGTETGPKALAFAINNVRVEANSAFIIGVPT